MKPVVALVAGVLFGVGLAVSGMANPGKVIGFLDLAGRWDPSLAFVMGGALLVTIPAFQLAMRSRGPLLGGTFQMPTRKDIDGRLVGGAALFGLGWGIAGFCPGPAIAGLATLLPQTILFVVTMTAGMIAYDRLSGMGTEGVPQRI